MTLKNFKFRAKSQSQSELALFGWKVVFGASDLIMDLEKVGIMRTFSANLEKKCFEMKRVE